MAAFRIFSRPRFLHSSSISSQVLVTKEYGQKIAVITLNNPTKLNALTCELGDQFYEAMQALKNDTHLRAAILTGAGSAFSAGGDLGFLRKRTQSSPTVNVDEMLKFYNRFLSIRSLPVPVISAVNGPAIGAGLCLAVATDMRIVSRSAKLGWTFATLGLHPGMAATHFTAKVIGPQLASKLLLTGEVFNGEDAVKMGLALEAVEPEKVFDAALHLAKRLADASPVANRLCIQTLRQQQDRGLHDSLVREAHNQAHSYASNDIQLGIKAVEEKKKPHFE